MTVETQWNPGIASDTVLDAESREWVLSLAHPDSRARETAQARLHATLLRIARGEVFRRSASVHITGPELDDVAHQAAADALMAIIGKLPTFRGESRFTTWAYKFVILEVSAKIGRHMWRERGVSFDTDDWDQLPDRFAVHPAHEAEGRELAAAVRSAVEEKLTPRQRRVFVALVLHNVPMDVLTVELNTNRNAIYKMMFDARRKVRAALVVNGYLDGIGVRGAHE